MSLCTLGMAAEFRDQGMAVNSLWPLTAINRAQCGSLWAERQWRDGAASRRSSRTRRTPSSRDLRRNAQATSSSTRKCCGRRGWRIASTTTPARRIATDVAELIEFAIDLQLHAARNARRRVLVDASRSLAWPKTTRRANIHSSYAPFDGWLWRALAVGPGTGGPSSRRSTSGYLHRCGDVVDRSCTAAFESRRWPPWRRHDARAWPGRVALGGQPAAMEAERDAAG